MTNKQTQPALQTTHRRPLLLRLTGLTLLTMTLIGWLRFFSALDNHAFLNELSFTPQLQWYLLFSGLLWGIISLPALWGLWRRLPWSPLAIWLAIGTILANYWLERLLLWENNQNARNWLFMAALSVLWILLVFFALKLPGNRQYLHSYHEKSKPINPMTD